MSDLLEAFRECGPLIGDPSVDALRARAATRILSELQRLRRNSTYRQEDGEDAVSEFVLRFIANGPRGNRPNDPQDDEAVASWFFRCLRHQLISLKRKTRREVQLNDSLPPNATGPVQEQPDIQAIKDELDLYLSRARLRMFDDVVPFVADLCRQDSREGFLEAIAQRRLIAEGKASPRDCILKLFRVIDRQTRQAFDKRQQRALEKLGEGVEAFIVAKNLADVDAHALRAVLDGLKNREAIWPSSDEEARA